MPAVVLLRGASHRIAEQSDLGVHGRAGNVEMRPLHAVVDEELQESSGNGCAAISITRAWRGVSASCMYVYDDGSLTRAAGVGVIAFQRPLVLLIDGQSPHALVAVISCTALNPLWVPHAQTNASELLREGVVVG